MGTLRGLSSVLVVSHAITRSDNSGDATCRWRPDVSDRGSRKEPRRGSQPTDLDKIRSSLTPGHRRPKYSVPGLAKKAAPAARRHILTRTSTTSPSPPE